MISPGFEKVETRFNEMFKEGLHNAAQLVVYQNGRRVADLAGNAPGSPPIDGDTPFLAFSISKAFTAMAVMRLVEEGKVELDAPVAQYWPEFAQGGKETATVRHALLHQAGIPAPHLNRQIFLWPSWRLVTRNVARERAVFPPGTQCGYHLVNFGFILGEVVRRVTGQSVDVYLKENFLEPMGLHNTWMRIPRAGLRRSPRLTAISPDMNATAWLFNLPIIRGALMPAACLHSTAGELAEFFLMLLNGGEYQGKRYLKAETIDLAASSNYDGYDQHLKIDINWGLGLIIGGGAHAKPDPRSRVWGYGSSEATFSALGMGTSMVWADRKAGVVMAFTCNGMMGEPGNPARLSAISNSIWDCLQG